MGRQTYEILLVFMFTSTQSARSSFIIVSAESLLNCGLIFRTKTSIEQKRDPFSASREFKDTIVQKKLFYYSVFFTS